VRLRVLLPLVYVVIGLLFLVMLGSSNQSWGNDPFYYASLPAVLLIQLTGVIPARSAAAMLVTFVAGIAQYALVGCLLDRLRAGRKRQPL
jgi:hypothetical protein